MHNILISQLPFWTERTAQDFLVAAPDCPVCLDALQGSDLGFVHNDPRDRNHKLHFVCHNCFTTMLRTHLQNVRAHARLMRRFGRRLLSRQIYLPCPICRAAGPAEATAAEPPETIEDHRWDWCQSLNDAWSRAVWYILGLDGLTVENRSDWTARLMWASCFQGLGFAWITQGYIPVAAGLLFSGILSVMPLLAIPLTLPVGFALLCAVGSVIYHKIVHNQRLSFGQFVLIFLTSLWGGISDCLISLLCTLAIIPRAFYQLRKNIANDISLQTSAKKFFHDIALGNFYGALYILTGIFMAPIAAAIRVHPAQIVANGVQRCKNILQINP